MCSGKLRAVLVLLILISASPNMMILSPIPIKKIFRLFLKGRCAPYFMGMLGVRRSIYPSCCLNLLIHRNKFNTPIEDNVSAAFFKSIDSHYLKLLLKVNNSIWSSGDILSNWKSDFCSFFTRDSSLHTLKSMSVEFDIIPFINFNKICLAPNRKFFYDQLELHIIILCFTQYFADLIHEIKIINFNN